MNLLDIGFTPGTRVPNTEKQTFQLQVCVSLQSPIQCSFWSSCSLEFPIDMSVLFRPPNRLGESKSLSKRTGNRATLYLGTTTSLFIVNPQPSTFSTAVVTTDAFPAVVGLASGREGHDHGLKRRRESPQTAKHSQVW